ncbi:F-box protein [Nymphaea thermarum]|nr:F-box protein [Nymphaea thermarum]
MHMNTQTSSLSCRDWNDNITLCCRCKANMNNLVQSLVPKFTNLQTLMLRQNKPQLNDEAVEAVANHCHDLQHLDLSKSLKLTDRALYAVANGCTQLVKLNISGCSDFSDDALAFLASQCRSLKHLNLCGCAKAASDKALQALAYSCNQLQFLNLGWCEGVGDVGVMSLARGCPDLRALDLCGCVLITGYSFINFMSSLISLLSWSSYSSSLLCSSLTFCYSFLVVDDSVISLANGCRHLRSLGLYYCQNITDRAMYSLANSRYGRNHEVWESVLTKHGEGLRNLNISQCTALTATAVQAVCDSFPALHTCPDRHSLIISGCLSLTSVHCACALQPWRSAGRAAIAQ